MLSVAGSGVLVRIDRAVRGIVHALGASPVVGAPFRVGAKAMRPLRRAIIGPRLDDEARRLAATLAARKVAPASGRALHVVLLCGNWGEAGSGIAIWTAVLARALARLGHRVVVMHEASAAPSDRFEDGIRLLGVQPSRLRRWPELPVLPPGLAEWQRGVVEAVLGLHAADPVDLVSGPIWLSEPLAMLRSGALPVAVSLHTTRAMLLAVGGRKDRWAEAAMAAERALLAEAPIVIANSAAAAADIAAASGVTIPPGRIAVVPHGLADLAAGTMVPPGREGMRLLFLGRLERRKGIDTLLAALPLLADLPDISVDIAGAPQGTDPEPGFRARHGDAAWASRVRFLGGVAESDKLALLAAADIVVLPARYESFGLVAVEAMMFGKPVVSTWAGGIPEVVEDGVTGLLVPPDAPEALAGALRRLIADAGLRHRLGAAGRERYVARFTDDAMAEHWVVAVRAALAERAGAAAAQ
jgi:hypothetical protein